MSQTAAGFALRGSLPGASAMFASGAVLIYRWADREEVAYGSGADLCLWVKRALATRNIHPSGTATVERR